MPFSLVPDRIFDDYAAVTPTLLRDLGVTLLLSDLDFTLAAKATRHPDRALKDYIAALRDAGIGLMFRDRAMMSRDPTQVISAITVSPSRGEIREASAAINP